MLLQLSPHAIIVLQNYWKVSLFKILLWVCVDNQCICFSSLHENSSDSGFWEAGVTLNIFWWRSLTAYQTAINCCRHWFKFLDQLWRLLESNFDFRTCSEVRDVSQRGMLAGWRWPDINFFEASQNILFILVNILKETSRLGPLASICSSDVILNKLLKNLYFWGSCWFCLEVIFIILIQTSRLQERWFFRFVWSNCCWPFIIILALNFILDIAEGDR